MDDETNAEGTVTASADGERERRWRLAIGADDEASSALSSDDKKLSSALDAPCPSTLPIHCGAGLCVSSKVR